MSSPSPDDDLQRAISLYTDGKKLTFTDAEGAVSKLQEALKLYCDMGKGNDHSTAPVYLAYGIALAETGRLRRGASAVFGPEGVDMQAAPGVENKDPNLPQSGQAEMRKEESAVKQDVSTLENIPGAGRDDAHGNKEDESEVEDNEEEEEGEEEKQTTPDDEKDFSLAWEMMEIARSMYLEV
jgi:HAT1-interacting factor 1